MGQWVLLDRNIDFIIAMQIVGNVNSIRHYNVIANLHITTDNDMNPMPDIGVIANLQPGRIFLPAILGHTINPTAGIDLTVVSNEKLPQVITPERGINCCFMTPTANRTFQ
jgi:hypothetical protein